MTVQREGGPESHSSRESGANNGGVANCFPRHQAIELRRQNQNWLHLLQEGEIRVCFSLPLSVSTLFILKSSIF